MLLVVMAATLGIWLSGTADDTSENISAERRIAAASGVGGAEPPPSPEPSEQPVVVPEPVRTQIVDPPSLRNRPAPAPAQVAPQQNPPRTADSKWFDIAGCTRIPFLTHAELVAATPVTSAFEGTKAVLRCGVMPINKIDEEVTLELTQSPVPGRFEPSTVRPGRGGMTIPQPPGGGAPQLFLGDIVHTTLTLDTERLPPGQYNLEITGRSASTHSSRTMTLHILSNVPPPAPPPEPGTPLPNPGDLPPFPVAPATGP